MTAFSAVGTLETLAGLAVIISMLWFGRRMEPHWVSKDGTRFTAKIQHVDDAGRGASHWREVKATIDGKAVVVLARGIGKRIAPFTHYTVDHRAARDTDGKAVFLLVGKGDDFLALRVPAKSRAVHALEAIISEV